MDGSRRKVVVNRSLSWPAGLAYDFVDDRMFWADEKLRCIGSANLNGDDIKVIVSRGAQIRRYLRRFLNSRLKISIRRLRTSATRLRAPRFLHQETLFHKAQSS